MATCVVVSGLAGDNRAFEVDGTSETLRAFKARVAFEFGTRSRDIVLSLGERALGSEELAMSLGELGLVDNACLTLIMVQAKVLQMKKEDGSSEGWRKTMDTVRIALYGDGTFLLMAHDDYRDESSGHSGWNSKAIYDVARGNYQLIDDGRVARCTFLQHFQREFTEDHWEARRGTNESSDSGWQAMVEQASFKWQRIELAGGPWETIDNDDVRIGDGRILGMLFKHRASGDYGPKEWPEVASEALGLLSLEIDSI
eukprot:TRINITY_DN77781_c0_g1_i1.p1 TRINITY_DN77781_c0_g1~~TRINITY_DN77781_c0_g1_i1.p1  ORF type:complete len:256 (-),score=50.51 TRINITY_DN77781_c0_g1_i1:152-919(-)